MKADTVICPFCNSANAIDADWQKITCTNCRKQADIVICPFCNSANAINADWQKITCTNCHEQLVRNDWYSDVWSSKKTVSCYDRSTLEKTISLEADNVNKIDLNVDLPDRMEPIAPVFIHKHGHSWFITSRSKDSVYVNGNKVRKHCELSAGDSISVCGAVFHLTGDDKIVPGKYDFGIKDIEFKSISASIGDKILFVDDVNIKAGEFIGIMGPSGCGKSSLLEIMVGLRRDARGKYLINGNDCQDGVSNVNFAYVPQDIVLHSELSLDEEIACFTQINIPNPVPQELIDRLLRRFGLETHRTKPTGKLSGGQRRRVGIMLELLRDPAILFLDEPTAGLDPKSESTVMKDLKSLSQQGRIIICSTHIMQNINLFDKIIFINANARLEFFGSPDELREKYKITDPVELYDSEPKMSYYSGRKSEPELKRSYNSKFYGFRIKEFCGYLKRTALETFKIDFSPMSMILSPLAILLFQPIAISFVLNFACTKSFFEVDKTLGFLLAVAVFWLGMNNSIRELVKERVPGRCLERLRGVKYGSYIVAKITWMISLCTVQVTLFYGTLWIYRAQPQELSESKIANIPEVFRSWEIALILLLVCIAGGFIGLAVSAFNKKENTAICFLPLVIIPVLFFSQPIMQDEKYADQNAEDKDNNAAARIIMRIMPCYGAQVYIQRVSEYNQKILVQYEAEKQSDNCRKTEDVAQEKEELAKIDQTGSAAVQQLCIWMACGLILMCIAQNVREKEWEGR